MLLRELHRRGELVLEAVAHLNHGIRGAAADGDEEFCRVLARKWDVAFEPARVDVPALARLERRSIEVTARHARRHFYEQVRQARSAACVATGHTQDDQAETVLLRMTRGTGVRGLGGIAPSRDGIIRPLLTCSRHELRAELEGHSQPWQEDATNADLSNPRNRVRHELLPALESHFNPAIRGTLARLADLARADEDALAQQAASVALQALQFHGTDSVRLDTARLASVHLAIARRVVQQALRILTGRGSHGADAVAAVQDVLTGHRRAAELSGIRVEHSGDFVVLVHTGAVQTAVAPFRFNLRVPGAVQATDGRWVLEAEGPRARQSVVLEDPISPDVVEIEAAGLGASLVVRSRQPGDRIRPLGLGGQKKLQDVFVDRKVRRSDRDSIPLVTDQRGRIVWVAGHVLEEDFRVTDHTKAVIILKLRRIERLGTWPHRDAR